MKCCVLSTNESGFYYLQSRYYDPNIGRFINADSISNLGSNNDFNSLNLFAYCGNNPVNRSDPDGSDWKTALFVGLAAIVVGLIILAIVSTGGAAGALAFAGVGASAGGLTAGAAAATVAAVGEATVAAGSTIAIGSLLFASINGGSEPTRLGKEGERQAGINSKGKTRIHVNGRERVPDRLTPDKLTEVKNVRYITRTQQLRDYEMIANSTSRNLELIVRAGTGTKVAQTVINAGWNIVRLIK